MPGGRWEKKKMAVIRMAKLALVVIILPLLVYIRTESVGRRAIYSKNRTEPELKSPSLEKYSRKRGTKDKEDNTEDEESEIEKFILLENPPRKRHRKTEKEEGNDYSDSE